MPKPTKQPKNPHKKLPPKPPATLEAKMQIQSHGKNRKWHINYLPWQTNKNRERYNLITNLIFWHFLDAVQVILSI